VRLPLNKIGSINKINKAFARLEQEHERPTHGIGTFRTAGNELGRSEDQHEQYRRRHLSMDAPMRDDGDSGNMYDLMSNSDQPDPMQELMNDSLRQEVERSLDGLTGREGDVIRLYFGLGGHQPHTLEEIGRKFDLTRERVRQIKEKAIRRLKHAGRGRGLRTYLDD
jgi:RNA polymerase primary sigma factor